MAIEPDHTLLMDEPFPAAFGQTQPTAARSAGAVVLPVIETASTSQSSCPVCRNSAASPIGPLAIPGLAPWPVKPPVRRRVEKPGRPLTERRLGEGREIVAAGGNLAPWYQGAKRVFDVAGALALLLILWPVMLVTWLALFITTGGKPIFRQERLGFCGRPFTLYKFRTMRSDAARMQHRVKNEKDGPIFKNRHDPRVTAIGRFLRSTSIDELPQLFNVLLGDMSLVGPRPPVPKEVAQYEPWQQRRLAVKPGLTCLWQVSGRSEIDFDEWVRMDLWYVRNQRLLVDLRLLLRTPGAVLSGRGAY